MIPGKVCDYSALDKERAGQELTYFLPVDPHSYRPSMNESGIEAIAMCWLA
jgi:hypothetical protein